MDVALRDGIERTLTFLEVIGYAPTRAELMHLLETGHGAEMSAKAFLETVSAMLAQGVLIEDSGRIGFTETVKPIIREIRNRDSFQPRKRRRAVKVAKYLAMLPTVRFVALANTTALGHARDFGDLDFFVVVKRGSLWRTRLLAVLPFKLLDLLPDGDRVRDAVCLSYFVADDALDVSKHRLTNDDPYFRYWFLSLLPLYDDGVSKELWEANQSVRARHPQAQRWMTPLDLAVVKPRVRLVAPAFFERMAEKVQRKWFPKALREVMNQDTRVMVNDQVLKFHVDDGREKFRNEYYRLCQKRHLKA